MASIKFVLRTHQEDTTGHSPLYIRIIKDRTTKFISTGVKLKETEWDDDKQRVKKNHSNSARINASLLQKLADAEGHVADTIRLRKASSAFQLKEAIKGKAPLNFFSYANSRLEKMRPSLSVTSYNCYAVAINRFKTFLASGDIYFHEITTVVINDYITYMNNVGKNTKSTQKTYVNVLKTFFKQAIKEKVITADMFDFADVTIKSEKGKRMFLSKEQLEQLKNFNSNKIKNYQIYVDMFLFSVYAGGLRFSDVICLKWVNFIEEESRIRTYIHKTKREHNFKIGKVALDILKKYQIKNANPDDYIFGLIDNIKLFESDRIAHTKIIKHFNKDGGRKLAAIGTQLKFPFPLTFHLSRHTFATNALKNGMRIEYVSKLMDHSDISVTQIYAKIISAELDKAVDSFIY